MVRTLPRSPADHRPTDDETVWQIVGPGWIYVVRDPGRAGNALVTMLVENLEEHVAVLVE